MRPQRVLISLAALALAAPLAAFSAVPGGRGDVAMAIPTPHRPSVQDVVHRDRTLNGPIVVTGTGAISQTVCDGCDGLAAAFQVARAPKPRAVAATNLAKATTKHCTDCGSSSVSVQVVLARTAALRADNRAVAENIRCESCTATAVAAQFVVMSSDYEGISEQAKALIAQIEADMADLITASAAPAEAMSTMGADDVEGQLEACAGQIEEILRRELGDVPIDRDLVIDRA